LRRILTDLQSGTLLMEKASTMRESILLDIEAEDAAERENTCGQVIEAISKPNRPDANARTKSDTAMKSALQTIPKLDAHKNSFDAKFEWSRYNRGLEKWKTATIEINKRLLLLPDEAAEAAARLIQHSVKRLEKMK
jgi:hypothetical protein